MDKQVPPLLKRLVRYPHRYQKCYEKHKTSLNKHTKKRRTIIRESTRIVLSRRIISGHTTADMIDGRAHSVDHSFM